MTKSRKMKKVGDKWKKSEGVSEEIEIDEKKSSTGYELYHKTFSDAMQHAYAFAKSKGHIVDPKEIDDKVATGPKKPSSGKTNRYSLKAGRKRVEIQVANLDNKRYELNMYIEGKEVDTTNNPLNKIKEILTRIRSLAEKPENKPPIEEQEEQWAPWLDAEAQAVQHQWPRMKTKLRVKWLSKIKKMADKEGMSQKTLDKILDDDYGLTKFPREKVWREVDKVKSKWKRMSTPQRTRWMDDLDDIAKKAHTSDADVKSILDDAGLKIKEEVELDEALKPVDKKVIDAFYNENRLAGKVLSSTGKSLEKHGVGGQTIAAWLDGKIAITAVSDVKSTEEILRYMKKSIPKNNFDQKSYKKFFEGIDIEKASMGAVIKDFQDSDAPQFNGKSDKKRKEMAIAAKLAADRNESVKEDEKDDPKSKKKDKINLKPKMDETMKNYKEFMKKVKEAKDTDPETPGKQGDNAEWKKARAGVLKKYGVPSCASIKDDKTKKQCFKDLDDSHVADHEEQTKKEDVEVDAKIKGYKDTISRILGKKSKEVKEGVTTGGIEYGEQDWDMQHRIENSYPNLDANFAEFYEQDLEGPYIWQGETYFFDRKVGSWYSVTAEDYVDDETSKELSLNWTKDGLYKRQFAS